jgi:hypothetical protein
LFGLEPGRYSIVPDVDIPDRGIEIRSVQPSAVTVTISEAVTNLESSPDEQVVSTNAITPTVMTAPPRSVRIPAICYLVPSSTISTGLQEICMGRRESE